MKADFKKRYGGGKADTAIAKSLNKEFGYQILFYTLDIVVDILMLGLANCIES